MAQPRYKSEIFVPIKKDTQTFEQRQKGLFGDFGDMHERMERRRKEWEEEVERMRSDFFRLKPAEKRRGSSENLLESRNINDIFYDDVKGGNKRFRVSFDVHEFNPNEVTLRIEDQKLLVNAKHEESGQGKSVSREFSRQIDIPRHVDPKELVSTLSNDGILQVEAPVPAPAYDQILHSAKTPPMLQAQPHLSSGPVVTEQDGSQKYKISVDIGNDFLPHEVFVKTVDKKLMVTARHEEKSMGRTTCKEFNREFVLPENVDPNLVVASMTDDGKLLVEAPVLSYTKGSYSGRPGSTKQPSITVRFGK